tara:strand:+ start:39 stop:929 length:891 start_codon:yes stop_codon:yes gene_type:complete
MTTKKTHTQIGFIGLGIMGKPMVLNLIKAGFKINFYARKKVIIKEITKQGGIFHDKLSLIAKHCNIIFLNLPDGEDVEEVICGKNNLWLSMRPNTVIIDMSTISPQITIKLNHKLKEKKSWLLDCPVSGGEIGAKKGKLSIMVGGEKKIFRKIKKFLEVLGDKITYIGKSGSGQITKACNQILVASTMIAVSEILLLAEKSKTDRKLVQSALLGGFANSKILEIHGKRMIEDNYIPGFKTSLHLKDLKIAIKLARGLCLDLKSAKHSKSLMQKAYDKKYQNLDSSVVNKIVKLVKK